jgi:hypothetical protein
MSSTFVTESETSPRDDVSIENFEEKCGPDVTPNFTEPATLEAMYRLAIDPSMLRRPTEADLAVFSADLPVREEARKLLTDRRSAFITQIKDERDHLLSQPRSSRSSRSTETEADHEDFESRRREALERVERTKKKEIEQVILLELIRERNQRRYEELRAARA